VIEHRRAGAVASDLAPRHDGHPDQYYSSADQVVSSIADGETDEENRHQQDVVENAVCACGIDRAAQLFDFAVKLFAPPRDLIPFVPWRNHNRL
jgi:hypothetical protein